MTHTITEILQAKRNADRVNIYINNVFWLGMSKNNLIALKLVPGKMITELEKGEIEKTTVNSNLIEKAINYITVRPRSCAQVREYLVLRKGIKEDEAENVIAYLQDKNLLSDEKFAEWYVDYKLNAGVNGLNKIKAELMGKKVPMHIIKDALERVSSNDEFKQNQLVIIEEFARKVINTIKAKDVYELRSKLTQRLMARGFKYDDIKKIVKTLDKVEG